MGRLNYLLAAALYLLPQIGIDLHEVAAAEACAECPEAAGPELKCADLDCRTPGHHHHEHRHHHPGHCRVCGSADFAAAEPSLTVDLAFTAETLLTPNPFASEAWGSLDRAIRGPPAAGL